MKSVDRRILVGVVVLIGSGIAAWTLLPSQRLELVRPPESSRAVTGTDARRGGELAEIQGDAAPARGRNDDRAPIAPPATGGLKILAVDASSGRPVPGAVIRVTSSSELTRESNDDERLEATLHWRDLGVLERTMRRVEPAGTTSEEGTIRITEPSAPMVLTAQSDLGWGWLDLAPSESDETRTVTLYPDGELKILVADSQGTPIEGARVRIRPADGVNGPNRGMEESTAVSEEGTGLASESHVGWLLHAHPTRTCVATVEALLAQPVKLDVDESLLSKSPARLVLPTVGHVQVRLSESILGDPAEQALFVLDGVRDTGESIARFPVSATRSLRKVCLGGSANFAVVETGLVLSAEARVGKPVQRFLKQLAGPRERGQTILVELEKGAEEVLEGKAVTQSGTPLAERTLYVSVRLEGSSATNSTTRTDAEGAYRLAISKPPARCGADISLRTYPESYGGAEPPLAATLRCTLAPEDVQQSIGNTVFREEEVLASGRVTDASDAGLSHVRVGATSLGNDPPPPKSGTVPIDRSSWAETDESGAFVLRGEPSASQVEIRVYPKALDSVRGPFVTVPTGTRDVHLIVRGAGSYSGIVRLDPDVREDAIIAVCWWKESASEKPQSSSCVLGAVDNGSARVHDERIPEGTVTISLTGRDNGRVLKSVSGIQIKAGEETHLDDIDLRGSVHPIRLAFRESDGSPIEKGEVYWSESGQQNQKWTHALIGNGKAVLMLTTEASIDIIGMSRGHRTVTVREVRSDLDVVLPPGIPVEVAVSSTLLPQGCHLEVCLAHDASDARKSALGFLEIALGSCDARGHATILMPSPGTYHASFTLVRDGNRGSGTPIRLEDVPTVQVSESESSMLEYRVPDAAISRAANGQD